MEPRPGRCEERAGIYLRLEEGGRGQERGAEGRAGATAAVRREPAPYAPASAAPPAGEPQRRSPLHLPPRPASWPGRVAAAPSSSQGASGAAASRAPLTQPASQRRLEPPPSTAAPYPAGASPSGRPLIHLAPLPSEATKPAWQ